MARMGFLHEIVGEEFSIQEVQLGKPDESILRVMCRDLIRLNAEIARRKSQLHQILSFTFPELKAFYTDEVTCKSARKLLAKYPTPQELQKASVSEVSQLLHDARDYVHSKRAGELISLAQETAGVELVNHHRWRQGWILEQLEVLENARKALLVQQNQLIVSHPYTPIIESLPISSPIWTASLISVIRDINRFSNYAKYRAMMGWFPKMDKSGTSVNSSKLSRKGVHLGRRVFGQMAMTLISPKVRETPFRIYYERLVNRGMPAHTALGHLAAKIATVLYICLKTMQPYDEAKHRRQLGLPVPDEPTTSVVIDIQDADIEIEKLTEPSSDLPKKTKPS